MNKNDKHIDSLQGLPNEQPFKVPEAYFETFEERLQQRIKEQSLESKPKGKTIRMLMPVLWLAASLVLVFLLVRYPVKMSSPDYSSEAGVEGVEDNISNEWLYDDNLYDMISEDMDAETIDNDDVADFLSAELSEYEIYSAMYN